MKNRITLMLFSCIVLLVVCQVQMPNFVSANFMQNLPYITINSDGSIMPETAYINRDGNVYTLTDNMTWAYVLIINCSNIIFDGGNHTINGAVNKNQWYLNIGLDLSNVTNVLVKNLKVDGFGLGDISLKGSNCDFINVTTAWVNLSCSFCNFVGCNFGYGKIDGYKYFAVYGDNNTFTKNNFEEETYFFGGNNCWDYDSFGNYWNNYGGYDTDHDGIGDSPYNVVGNQQDNYPLIKPFTGVISQVPTVTPSQDSFNPENSQYIIWLYVSIIIAVAILIIIGSSLLIITRKRKKLDPNFST